MQQFYQPDYQEQPGQQLEEENLRILRTNVPESEEDIPVLCRNYITKTQRLDWVLTVQSLYAVQELGRISLENLMGFWNTYLSMTRGTVQLPGFPSEPTPKRRNVPHVRSVREEATDLARACPLYIAIEKRMNELEYPLVKQLGTEAKARDQLKKTNSEYSGLVNQKDTIWKMLQYIALYRMALNHFLHHFENHGRRKFV